MKPNVPAAEGFVPPVPGRLRATVQVFRTAGWKPLRGRKGIALGLLVLVPSLLLVVGRIAGGTRGMGTLFFMDTLVPAFHYIELVVYLFLGCSVLGEGIAEGSLLYDLACPIRRSSILSGRFLAYLRSTWTLLLPAVTVAFAACMTPLGWEAFWRGLPLLLSVLAVTAGAALVYGAFFVLLSLLLKRAVLVGIILSVAIDGFIAYLPLRLSSLSLHVHFRNLMACLASEDRLREMVEGVTIPVSCTTSMVVVIAAFLVFFAGGVVVFRGKEFP